MNQSPFPTQILDDSKDFIWVVDSKLSLVYANKAYLSLMKEVTGMEKDLNIPVLVEAFGEGGIEKWESYYQRAFSGEYFKIEEHFYNPNTKEMQYGHITFSPIRDEPGEILNVACRSTDITPGIRQEWEFAIKDNGIKIDPRFFNKIFVISQRLHNRETYDGTGIGLSIAKRSVEFLGGDIWLESTVGEGTKFYFTISKNN